jgi:hypothetical protein
MYTTGIENKSNMCHPGIKFLTPVATWSGQYTGIVVKPPKYVLCFLKGGNVDDWSIDTTHTPPLFSFYTTFKEEESNQREG